jgi:hypothetical protein
MDSSIMKNNKLLIFIWFLIIVSGIFLYQRSDSISVLEKGIIIVLGTVAGFINISAIIRNNKKISFDNGILTIQQTFQKEKKYNLQDIRSWAQYDYHLFGHNTGHRIILKTRNGKKINLSIDSPDDNNEDENALEFKKFFDFLNENLSGIKEN